MGRINAKTIGYAILMVVIVFAVGYLMTRVARTDSLNRYLITIAAVVAGAILVGGLGAVGLRGLRSKARKDEPSSG